jgi:hypothetical protein
MAAYFTAGSKIFRVPAENLYPFIKLFPYSTANLSFRRFSLNDKETISWQIGRFSYLVQDKVEHLMIKDPLPCF